MTPRSPGRSGCPPAASPRTCWRVTGEGGHVVGAISPRRGARAGTAGNINPAASPASLARKVPAAGLASALSASPPGDRWERTRSVLAVRPAEDGAGPLTAQPGAAHPPRLLWVPPGLLSSVRPRNELEAEIELLIGSPRATRREKAVGQGGGRRSRAIARSRGDGCGRP